MNFSLIRKDSTFRLFNDDKEIADFKYNRSSNSIRIHYTQKRLFFLSQEGFLQNKVLLKTEYGVHIGENAYIKNQRKGTMHLSEKKFQYTIGQDGVQLFDRKKELLANVSFDGAANADSHEVSVIMFSLAWLLISEDTSLVKQQLARL